MASAEQFFLFFITNLLFILALPSNAATDQPPVPVITTIYKDPETQEFEYFIDIKSIKIDEISLVHFDNSLLSFNEKTGFGGTKLFHEAPYTILHNSIYKPFVDEFVKAAAARNITVVAPVAPFGVCLDTGNLHWREDPGPLNVPVIEVELEVSAESSPYWRIRGANSMVKVNNDVVCLGFVDGGLSPRASIVVGALQSDYLTAFDAAQWLSRHRRVSKSSLARTSSDK